LYNPSLKHVGVYFFLLKKEKLFFPKEKGPKGRLKLCGHTGSCPPPVSGTALAPAEQSRLAEGLGFGEWKDLLPGWKRSVRVGEQNRVGRRAWEVTLQGQRLQDETRGRADGRGCAGREPQSRSRELRRAAAQSCRQVLTDARTIPPRQAGTLAELYGCRDKLQGWKNISSATQGR